MPTARTTVLCAALLVSGVTTYALARPPATLAQLTAAEGLTSERGDARATRVWFIFRPTDCKTGTRRIDTLNVLNAKPGVRVVGVMVGAPSDSTEAARVAASFGATFPVLIDTDRRWVKSLDVGGLSAPVYAVRDPAGLFTTVALDSAGPLLEAISSRPSGESEVRSLARPGSVSTGAPRQLLGELRLLHTVTSTEEKPLASPGLVRASGDRVYVFDYGDNQLKAFDESGPLRWAYGSGAAGQTTFSNPTDAHVDAVGNVTILDAAGPKATTVTNAGNLIKTVRLSRDVHRLTVTSRGALWGLDASTSDAFGFAFDVNGRVTADVPLPSELKSIPPIARESWVAALPGSDSVAVAYHYADHIGLLDLGARRFAVRRGVEQSAFPSVVSWNLPDGGQFMRVAPNATTSALAVTADAKRIYVLYMGSGALAGRVLDVYSRASAQYEGSYTLPKRVSDIARTRLGFVSIERQPVPALKVWRFPAN